MIVNKKGDLQSFPQIFYKSPQVPNLYPKFGWWATLSEEEQEMGMVSVGGPRGQHLEYK